MKLHLDPFSGGVTLTFIGSNLDIVQSPLFRVTDSRFTETIPMVSLLNRMIPKRAACLIVGINSYLILQHCKGTSTMLTCVAPELVPPPSDSDYSQELNYTVIMDNASGPDITQSTLSLVLNPDPRFTTISESSRMIPIGQNATTITINVGHSDRGLLAVVDQ